MFYQRFLEVFAPDVRGLRRKASDGSNCVTIFKSSMHSGMKVAERSSKLTSIVVTSNVQSPSIVRTAMLASPETSADVEGGALVDKNTESRRLDLDVIETDK